MNASDAPLSLGAAAAAPPGGYANADDERLLPSFFTCACVPFSPTDRLPRRPDDGGVAVLGCSGHTPRVGAFALSRFGARLKPSHAFVDRGQLGLWRPRPSTRVCYRQTCVCLNQISDCSTYVCSPWQGSAAPVAGARATRPVVRG